MSTGMFSPGVLPCRWKKNRPRGFRKTSEIRLLGFDLGVFNEAQLRYLRGLGAARGKVNDSAS